MGYCMKQLESKFAIKKENLDQVLAAIKGLHGKKDSYSWIRSDFHKINNLTEMFKEWCWELSFDEDGNVNDIEFMSDKMGDEEAFLQAIAPYVETGSYIKMHGEDGDTWKWRFKNGKLLPL